MRALWLVSTLALFGCGPSGEAPVCVPGRTLACQCEVGVGTQVCRADGSGFDDCRACSSTPLVAFRDVAREVGVAYVEAGPIDGVTPCAVPGYCDMNLFTGAVAVGDYDGDEDPDVFVSRLGAPPLLFRNRGDGRFDDVTVEAGLATLGNWNGAAWGDIDNDGDLDLVAQTLGLGRHYLFVNQGDGHFVEEAHARGVAQDDGLAKIGMSVGFGDYDRDGWLDVHVSEWSVKTGPFALNAKSPTHSRLFRNRGLAAPGVFDDVTLDVGAEFSLPDAEGNYPSVFSFGSGFADFDGDDWLDLAVSGEFGTSRFLWNDGGTFTDLTLASGLGRDQLGMGSSIADIDGDGALDWLVSSLSRAPNCANAVECSAGEAGNHLYRYLGGRVFEDVAATLGVNEGYWAWGAVMFDPDHDGDLDVFQTNGMDFPTVPPTSFFASDPNRFWRNDGGTFTETSAALGLGDSRRGKGVALLDFDGDGDQDLFVVNNANEPCLFRNDAAVGHWLRVRVLTESGRDALGARVRVTLRKGEAPRVAIVGGATQFLGQSEPHAHFGLGDLDGEVHEVEVHWHDTGKTKTVSSVPVDTRLSVSP